MSSAAIIILFILASGYAFNISNIRYKLKLSRLNGQHLYNKLLFQGVLFFVSSVFIFNSVKTFINANNYHYIRDFLVGLNVLRPEIGDKIFVISIFSLFLSFFVGFIIGVIQDVKLISLDKKLLDKKNREEYIFLRHAAMGNPVNEALIEAFLERSNDENDLRMIFMSDRKVYVGSVMELLKSESESEDITHFEFAPMKSGYRDKDTLEVTITTNYSGDGDLSLILKNEDVVSIRKFDESQFERFVSIKEQNQSKK